MKFKDYWWKILGVLLIAYSFVAGLLTPLAPGIVKVDPVRSRSGGTVQMSVVGYNSHYNQAAVDAWLKLDQNRSISASEIAVQDARHLTATFALPTSFPGTDTINVLSLVLYNEIDGHSILPGAIFITGNDGGGNDSLWSDDIIQVDEASGFHFPFRNILLETIRNTFFHVQLWMAMMFIFTVSLIHSIAFLRKRNPLSDHKAAAYASAGLLLGLLGICTGAIWAKNSWGAYWSFDVKQNMAAIAMLIYAAYFILRSSIADRDVARRFSAVYNIFAFLMLVPLLYIIPRMTASLHPGSGGNPAFGSEDLDNTMRMVFYPAIIGWILFSSWIANVYWRYLQLQENLESQL
ncbi:MAG: cytochrome c biogenesis protein CcsA [Saprospiraceae bacterium]|nr:cytochrome c biogenesis protein CcsA [Saprospiraceae bacterium]